MGDARQACAPGVPGGILGVVVGDVDGALHEGIIGFTGRRGSPLSDL
jgi:hypothetical protein